MNKRVNGWLAAYCVTLALSIGMLIIRRQMALRSMILSIVLTIVFLCVGLCAMRFTRHTEREPAPTAVLRAACMLLSVANALYACINGSLGFMAAAWVGVICAAIPLWRGCGARQNWLRVIRVVVVLPFVVSVAVGVFRLVFSMIQFSKETVVQSAMSPNGQCCAQLIDYDEGALGGRTYVRVARTIKIGSATLTLYSTRVYSESWKGIEALNEYEFKWLSDDEIDVNGTRVRLGLNGIPWKRTQSPCMVLTPLRQLWPNCAGRTVCAGPFSPAVSL